MSLCGYVQMNAGAHGDQKRVLDPPAAGQATVSQSPDRNAGNQT